MTRCVPVEKVGPWVSENQGEASSYYSYSQL